MLRTAELALFVSAGSVAGADSNSLTGTAPIPKMKGPENPDRAAIERGGVPEKFAGKPGSDTITMTLTREKK